ncbi:MAG: hypothetical protein ACRD3V_25405 [Vicinamibacteria bacterium]
MSFWGRLVLSASIHAALASGAEAQPPSEPPSGAIRFETSDRELIQRLARENAVAASVPRRGVTAYLAHLGHRLVMRVMELLRPFSRYARGVGSAVGRTVVVAALLTAVFLLFVVARFLLRRRRSRRAPNLSTSALPTPEVQLPSWDTARWRQELQDRIDRSDVAGSLEALWWWLARSVLGSRVQDSWTSGDLLSSANRAGLREPVRRLERMMYGSERPSLQEVGDLLLSLERQLA